MSELYDDEIVEEAADGVMLDIPVCALCRGCEPCAQCRRDAVNYARLALEAAAPLIAARALRAAVTDRHGLARVIWEASRADEGTISAIGAEKVADAVARWMTGGAS